MKTKNKIMASIAFIGLLAITLSAPSCMALKKKPAPIVYVIDPVCGMKVDISEGFVWKYEGVTYHFDSYNCKEAFKMAPNKFIVKK